MSRIRSFLVLIIALAACACTPAEHHEEEQGVYAVTSPLRQDTEITSEYVAQVRAIQHIELRALEHGYLQEIFVDEGQDIEKGTLMFQIMPIIYKAEVSRSKAEVDKARIEYKNAKLLADKKVIASSELALAKATLDRAKAELSLANAHLRLTEVHAPFSGIMGRFHVRKGSLLEEGELLTTMSDNSTVWVYFNVSEKEYLEYKSRADSDSAKTVELRMANGELFDQVGTIETIEADFNNETGNIAFRAAFPNPEGLLRHGETGKILMRVPLADALLIPQKATFEILDKRYVYVVDDEGVVRTRAITVAAELPHRYVVDSGLEEGERILLEGLRKVHEGDAIEVEYEDPQAAFEDILALHAE